MQLLLKHLGANSQWVQWYHLFGPLCSSSSWGPKSGKNSVAMLNGISCPFPFFPCPPQLLSLAALWEREVHSCSCLEQQQQWVGYFSLLHPPGCFLPAWQQAQGGGNPLITAVPSNTPPHSNLYRAVGKRVNRRGREEILTEFRLPFFKKCPAAAPVVSSAHPKAGYWGEKQWVGVWPLLLHSVIQKPGSAHWYNHSSRIQFLI